MPDIRELGRRVKAKYPGAYNDLDDADLGRRVKAKYPGAYDDFADAVAAQPSIPTGQNLAVGAARGQLGLTEPVEAAGGIVARLATGDFTPVRELGRGFGLRAAQLYAATQPGGSPAVGVAQAAIDQEAAQRQARQIQQGNLPAIRRAGQEAQLSKLEAQDPSLRGKLTRGAISTAIQSAPYLAAGPGGIPALAATGAAMSIGEPENLPINVTLAAAPLPIGQAFKAGVNSVRRAFGKGAAQIIEAEASPAAVARVPEAPPIAGEAIPSPVAPAIDPLQSTFAKLGTDNVDQIGAMFANANRRLNKKITPEQRASAVADYNALKQLTPDEHNTLSQLLPERGFNPAAQFAEGGYAREIRDIPMSERNAQLDANLRQLEAFFQGEGRTLQTAEDAAIMGDIGPGATSGQFGAQPARVSAADLVTTPPPATPSTIGDRIRMMARTPESSVSVSEVRRQFPDVGKKEFDDEMVRLVEEGQIALRRHDAPGQLTAAERDAMVKIGDNYFTAATVTGPRAQAAPFEVAPPAAAAPPSPPLPPGEIPTGFGGQPPGPQLHLFDYAPSLSRLSHIWQRTKDELFGALGATKSIKSSFDISYPFRQGMLLLARPLQWRQIGKVWESAFKGFRTKNFEEIKQAIEFHPLAKRMEDAGLYRGTVRGEEAFPGRVGSKISEVVEKTPGIKHSQQAFTAAADTQRVQAFEQYARAIDRARLSTAEALKADKAAAEWINIATGRGSLGQKIDKAFDALNLAFFSPRYIASRLNIFNPVTYGRNLMSPGGRVVLRQQMADLAQFTGVVATTLYLAKQAGADVGLNPESPDFLKIRFGNHRYDTLAGLQQVMRAGYRISADVARAARGEKPKFGESAIDIGETFLSYKLAPPASVFKSFIEQRTPGGKEFTAGRAAADLVAPIQWADFVDAWRDESFGSALKTLPGAVGIGAQHYQLDPVEAALDRNRPLLSELQRLKIRVAELQRGKDKQGNPELDDKFNARIQQFGQNYTSYGLQLIQHPRFQIASDEVKTKALKRLNEKAKGLTHKQFAFPEIELDPGLILDSVQK